MPAEQVERERQGDRSRVMAGEQEDQHLVADLEVGQPLVAVAGGDQPAEQVLAGGAVRAARRDQVVAHRIDGCAGPLGAAIGRRRPRARSVDGVVGPVAGVLAEDREGGADHRHRPLDVGPEQQPADHAQGEHGHLAVQVDRPALGPARGEQRLGLLAHRARVAGDAAAREQRLHEAALAQPLRVLAVEKPVAERPADLLVEAVVLAVGVGLGGEHAPHAVRMEDGVALGAHPRRAGQQARRRRRARGARARACPGCRA